MTIIEKIIVKYLLNVDDTDKIFFASLLTSMTKEESKATPSMGVTIRDGQLYLLYNKDFVERVEKKLGIQKLKGILEHECLHIVYEHLNRAQKFNRHPLIYNLATDMAINQLIDERILPKKIPVIDSKGQEVMSDLIFPSLYRLPKEKNAEWYYNKLFDKMKQKGQDSQCNQCKGTGKCDKCGGSGSITDKQGVKNPCDSCNGSGKCSECDGAGQNGTTLDDHDIWKNIKGSEQISKEIVKKAVKDAYENTKKARGHISGQLEEAISELLKPPTINWKVLLRQYIGASIKTGFKSSWKRPNRRFADRDDVKGKVSNRTIKMLLAVDTSGSVSDKDFNDFIVEMKGILNVYKCNIDIIQCDAEINKTETLKPYTKLNIKFTGRGGTDYKPVFDYLHKRPDYDLLLYFTDLYCDFRGCKSTRPVIWVTTQDYDRGNKVPFGKVVHIKNDKQGENDYADEEE